MATQQKCEYEDVRPRLFVVPPHSLSIVVPACSVVARAVHSPTTFDLMNPSSDRKIAFKIKGNCPDLVAVSPKAAFLKPREVISVKVRNTEY